MKSKWIDKSPKTLAVVFEANDDVISGLNKVVREYKLAGSHFTGIGACQRLTLGFFDRKTKQYTRCIFKEQMKVLSLTGDIALDDKGPVVHAHLVVGREDGRAYGGHLLEASVWPTLEIIIVESPEHLHRRFNPEVGLALIDL